MHWQRVQYVKRRELLLFLIAGFFYCPAYGAKAPPEEIEKAEREYSVKFENTREKTTALEKQVIASLKNGLNAADQVKRIRKLLSLQQEERKIGQERMKNLEKFIIHLEERREYLQGKLESRKSRVRQALMDINRSRLQPYPLFPDPENEQIEAPRREVLSRMVKRGIREIEIWQADLADAEQLERRIAQEKEQLAYLFEDLKERESLLEFHRKLQLDVIRKNYQKRLDQFAHYRQLKNEEDKLEKLIKRFNTRVEFGRIQESERTVSRLMSSSEILKEKGKLPPPVFGSIIGTYGRQTDPVSNLKVFKKGIEILPSGTSDEDLVVRAIFAGKVVYAGELPGYGNVSIMDHGAHTYSISGRLGKIFKKVGDYLAAGEALGMPAEKKQPIYFEIRSRNVALNPLQWISN